MHHEDQPLLMPNAWDIGSARLLESLGFRAIATTSSGFAATLGRLDGGAGRDDMLEHCRALSGAVSVPISADLEDGYAEDPDGVADTVRQAVGTGIAGCSVEDYDRGEDRIHSVGRAVDRVRAAADAAHGGGNRLVLTARAENFLHGRPDLADTIDRLQAFQDAGADVLFAPGIDDREQLRTLVASVDLPVNVLPRGTTAPVPTLAEIGVRRISVGGSFAWTAYAAMRRAAAELRDAGTYGYWADAADGVAAARSAFAD